MSINPDSPIKTRFDGISDATALLDSADAPGSPTDEVNMISVETAEDTAAATTIQAAFRTYQIQKNLTPEMCAQINRINQQCQGLHSFMGEVQNSVHKRFQYHILDQPKYNEAIGEIRKARDDLEALRGKIDAYLSCIPSISCEEFEKEYGSAVYPIRDQLCNVAGKQGFASLKGGLNSLLGTEYKETFSDACNAQISHLNRIVQPLGYKMYDVSEMREDGIVITNDEGWEILLDNPDLQAGLPCVEEMTSYDPANLNEKLHGAEIIIPLIDDKGVLERVLSMKVSLSTDPLNIKYLVGLLASRKTAFIAAASQSGTPAAFRENYLEQYSVRDFLTRSPEQYGTEVTNAYKEAQRLGKLKYVELADEFKKAEASEQIRILTLMFISDNSDYGYLLYETLLRGHRDYRAILRRNLHYSVGCLLDLKIQDIQEMRKRLMSQDTKGLDTKSFILASKASDAAKSKALERLQEAKDSNKAKTWLNAWKRIPWGKVAEEPVTMADGGEAVRAHMQHVRDTLDTAIYGQDEAKETLMEVCGEAVARGGWNGSCIAFQGPPGNGKTTLAREGIAKAFDRPFAMIALGGASDASFLVGHNYTYVGSQPGRIVDLLTQTKCMNPVIYIDELDKLSDTPKGREIIGVLTHLTDTSQNKEFQDKYFAGIDFDLSQALIVFSYNDESAIDPILKDRMITINTKALNRSEKVVIAQKYLLPDLCKLVGFNREHITISDKDVSFIVENYTMEAGVRSLKRSLHKILRRLNLERLYEPSKFDGKIDIDRKTIIHCLKEPHLEVKKVAEKPHVGIVNGLSVNSFSHTGSVMAIQVAKTISKNPLELELTGRQMEVMQESMSISRTVALNIVPDSVLDKLHTDRPYGLAIHCPEASVKKDGPSAGGAITTAIVSQITGIPVRNDVAMTGEIDLRGNISAIGGLGAKLDGAKKAGAKLVLCPKENLKDLEKTRKDRPDIFEGGFEAIAVEHIHEVLKHALVPNDLVWKEFC